MGGLAEKLTHYLLERFGLRVDLRPWKGQTGLPLFLLNLYQFYESVLFGRPCLFVLVKEGALDTPRMLKKHMDQIQERWEGVCIFVIEGIVAYNRDRLIHQGVPFLVPDKQMYLAPLGIDLREYGPASKVSPERLRPATQAVLICGLSDKSINEYTISHLVEKVGYSRMTISRAFDELEVLGLGEVFRRGRERGWRCRSNRRELWEQARGWMLSPVQRRIWIDQHVPGVVAGLSALAEQSMLNPPSIPVVAVTANEGTELRSLPSSEEAQVGVELWSYSPYLWESGDRVDPFSLYLSLVESEDERVQMALDDMLEVIEW